MKAKPALLRLLALMGLLIGGCATAPKPLYYYGSYSRTLYKLKKDPTAQSSAKHQASLEEVIRVSKEKNLRVPPGIYCEYGYLLWQEKRQTEAEAQFNLEMQTYPESTQFVTTVIKNLKHEPSS